MVCKTKIQADKVAGYGASKMDAQGYVFEQVGPCQYAVSKPGQAVPYIVNTCEAVTDITDRFCTCEFAKENRSFGTCKHYRWVVNYLSIIDDAYKVFLLNNPDLMSKFLSRE